MHGNSHGAQKWIQIEETWDFMAGDEPQTNEETKETDGGFDMM